ncbi:MAG: Ig-like domain-containing protein, partial [Sedimenticola sp.]
MLEIAKKIQGINKEQGQTMSQYSKVLGNLLTGLFFIGLFTVNSASAVTVDQDCVVNILNRTVQVGPDGLWSMPNVPSTMGQIRARITCTRDGKTLNGQTDYFAVETNGRVEVGDFIFEQMEPVPVTLQFQPFDAVTLNGVDATLQLSVVATYPDGSTKDVTNSTSGINYIASNSVVATVDSNGLVVGASSGNVLISARKDGVLALRQIKVITSGDTDGDDLPDDYEIANGLDPSDPLDAMEDQDSDGLSALDEYNLGTDPQNKDTDRDGISDGEETIAGKDGYISDPLLTDTDGDGLPDGVEVTVGSDPSDRTDANYSSALTGINVIPNNAVIYYNTIDGESSIQLQVSGTLIDGSELDLTSKSRGTNYATGDITIASFGLDDGKVFAGQDGVAEITVDNDGHTAIARFAVISFTPDVVSYLQLPGDAKNVKVQDDYAYIPAANSGLWVVNLSSPETPFLTATLELPGNSQDVRLAGNYAYVANGVGLSVVDITEPRFPHVIGAVETLGNAQDIAFNGNYLYLADGAQGLSIIDVSTPETLVVVSTLSLGGSVTGVGVEDNTVVAVVANNAVSTVDVTDPAAPVLLGSVGVSGARDLEVRDGYAHVAAYSSSYYRVIDINNPGAPVDVGGSTSRDFVPIDVALSEKFAFFGEQFWVSAIPYVNIINPANPVFQGVIDMSRFSDYDCQGVDADETYAYCVAKRGASNRLYIAQYRGLVDTAGIFPTVALTAPAEGSVLYQNRPYKLTAEATDDIRVATVNFTVNGEVVSTDTTAPFEYVYKIPTGISNVTFGVIAVDLAGNQAITGNIAFPVDASTFIDELWNGVTIDYFTDDLTAAAVSMTNASYVSAHKLISVGDFVVTGPGPSTVEVSELIVEGDLVVDGTTLTVKSSNPISVLGNVRLLNGGKLTVPNADKASSKIYKLELNVTGSVE